MDKRSIHNTGRESSHHLSLSDIFRAPTHFQYAIFIHFPYLFKTKLKGFNTIISLHFSKLLFMEHNANNICRTVISGKERSLNEQRVEKGKKSAPFQLFSVHSVQLSLSLNDVGLGFLDVFLSLAERLVVLEIALSFLCRQHGVPSVRTR